MSIQVVAPSTGNVLKIERANSAQLLAIGSLAPGWVAETIAIWTQFPARKGILDLTNRNLPILPEEIFRMRKLEKLILNNNIIQEIPNDLAKLAEAGLLKRIECNENKLTVIGEEIGLLTTIEEILLSHNQLPRFPFCFTKLYQLSYLDLSHNEMEDIPDEIGNLLFLQYFNCSNNKIKNLPKALLNISSLTILDVSFNEITSIPSTVGELKKINKLKLNDNKIDELPNEIGFLLTLEELSIENNPFNNQKEIVENQLFELHKILQFLRNRLRLDQGSRSLLFTEKDNPKNTSFEIVEGEEKPVLVGATVEKLILFLTQVVLPDEKTLSCVKLCYSYFIDPTDLIELFILRFHMNQSCNKNLKKDQRRVEEIVSSRAIAGIELLLQQFNIDNVTYPPKFSTMMREFIQEIGISSAKTILFHLAENPSINLQSLGVNEDLTKDFRKIKEKEKKKEDKIIKDQKKKVEQKRKKFKKERKKDIKVDRATERLGVGLSHSADEKHILLFTASEIALQIALMDSEYFCAIPPNQFLHQSWQKNPVGNLINACISQFNNISNWAATWLVKQIDVKIRVRTLQHLLDIASELFELGDFLALFAFASTMSNAAISRLKNTIKQLDEKRKGTMTLLEQLVDHTNNYRNYKNMREIRIAESGHCVPNLALYLRNLTFMEDGNPNYLNDSDMVNIGKFRLILKTIDEITEMKSLSYMHVIDPDPVIQKLINQSPRIDSAEELYQQSLLCEPSLRGSAAQLRKKLKDENSQEIARRSSLPTSISKTLYQKGSTPGDLPQPNGVPAALESAPIPREKRPHRPSFRASVRLPSKSVTEYNG